MQLWLYPLSWPGPSWLLGVSGPLSASGPSLRSPRPPKLPRSFPAQGRAWLAQTPLFAVKSAFICSEQTPGSLRSRLMDANVNVHLFNWIRPQDKRDKRLPVC